MSFQRATNSNRFKYSKSTHFGAYSFFILCLRRESNPHPGLRTPLLYPLSYEGKYFICVLYIAGVRLGIASLREQYTLWIFYFVLRTLKISHKVLRRCLGTFSHHPGLRTPLLYPLSYEGNWYYYTRTLVAIQTTCY